MAVNEAHAFAMRVANGNPEALEFCDLWYRYCHGIDDLLDTMVDGRPTMTKEKILEIFITAAMLYNCRFYRTHNDLLLGIVFTVTSAYADSVAWEKDPKQHRRVIADVLRTCGDEMFFMIAAITGGWQHMRLLSGEIRERDFVLQHTQPDDFH
jgi:hypothetical protein